MSLRARIAVIAAAAVAIAVLVASAGLYVATARALRGSVDRALVDLARDFGRPGPDGVRVFGPRPGRLGGAGGFVQYVTARGRVLGSVDREPLPVDTTVTDVAAGRRGPAFETVEVSGEPVRILTIPVESGVAAQIARPLGEVEAALALLRRRLALGSLAGIALAGLLGTVVAHRAIRPVHDLTDLAEEIAATQDLSRRIEVLRDDEIGRLARTLNTMLANLEQARRAQEQLVADASHELRTPLTSLRTNVEVLADADRLDADERRRLISDVVTQLDEFARLIGALIELARGDRPAQTATPLRLDELVARAVDRTRSFAADGQHIDLHVRPTTVVGDAERLERAVTNLLDNAVKYGGGAPIDVEVSDGEVTVRDRGPGIATEHLDRVFDRFYRAPEARGSRGAGLGLAIVRQIAGSHGGSVAVSNAPGGGASFTITLPTAGWPAG